MNEDILAKVERVKGALREIDASPEGFKAGLQQSLGVVTHAFPDGPPEARLQAVRKRLLEWVDVSSISEYGRQFGKAVTEALALLKEEFPDE